MPHKTDGKASGIVTKRDCLKEGIIDSLRYLADEAERQGMQGYAALLDDAFKRVLVFYVTEKKLALTSALVPLSDIPPNLLN